jgi:hypothetical protein
VLVASEATAGAGSVDAAGLVELVADVPALAKRVAVG